jgi:ribonuclease VapC
MVLDASAVVAVLRGEPEEGAFKQALAFAPVRRMSPVNWFEVAINAEKAGSADVAAFKAFCERIDLIVAPVTEEHMHLAHQAWRRYGKGRNPARLNLGDCFAYALAKALNEPLLFKGGDFSKTDIKSAL